MKRLLLVILSGFILSACNDPAGEHDHQLLNRCLDQDLRLLGEDTALVHRGTELSASGKKDGYKEFGTGFLLLANKDSNGARQTFRQMIAQKHSRWLGYCGLGLSAWKLKQYSLAKSCYDSALLRTEKQPEIWYLKGLNEIALDTSGRYIEAIRCFEMASKFNEKHYYALYMSGLCHYMGDSTSRGLKKAIPYMEKAIAMNPKNPAAYVFLADNYDTYHEKIRYTQMAISAGHIPSIRKMAVLKMNFGDYESALTYFNQYLAYENNNPENHIDKASCLMAMGKYDEAMTALSYARALDPSVSGNHVHYRKSLILFDQQKYPEALKEIDIVLGMNTYEQTEYYVHKARILIAMNKKAQAKQVLDQYLSKAAETDTDVTAAENMKMFYFGE